MSRFADWSPDGVGIEVGGFVEADSLTATDFIEEPYTDLDPESLDDGSNDVDSDDSRSEVQ
jgi:hypothetical protein